MAYDLAQIGELLPDSYAGKFLLLPIKESFEGGPGDFAQSFIANVAGHIWFFSSLA